MTIYQYAAKRQVTHQAIQKTLKKVGTFPDRRLPGVTAISKQGREYALAVAGQIRKGRAKKYYKIDLVV